MNFYFIETCKVSGMDAKTNTTCACADLTYFDDVTDTCKNCDNIKCATCLSDGQTCGKFI